MKDYSALSAEATTALGISEKANKVGNHKVSNNLKQFTAIWSYCKLIL